MVSFLENLLEELKSLIRATSGKGSKIATKEISSPPPLLLEKVNSFLKKGAIWEAREQSHWSGLFPCYFLLYKKEGDKWFILELRVLNKQPRVCMFQMLL
uniref:Uncharacterized protein n=1 Tax=Sphaerodactylus townsendi TaxID=933632 RepID=A0ACB8FHH1_9SAUR